VCKVDGLLNFYEKNIFPLCAIKSTVKLIIKPNKEKLSLHNVNETILAKL
jgi:hypothetical protein